MLRTTLTLRKVKVKTYLGDGCEAVGGARGVGHDVRASLLVLVVVDAHDVHRGVILRGCRDEHLLSSACRYVTGIIPWKKLLIDRQQTNKRTSPTY